MTAVQQLIRAPWVPVTAYRAYRYASKHDATGMSFDRFGRHLGLRLLQRGRWSGLKWLLRPMVLERYFEFPYALSCIPDGAAECLDVSSPSLFSMYFAVKHEATRILMINPDDRDISRTAAIVDTLGLRNITCQRSDLENLPKGAMRYDCIWCISVIEHIRTTTFDDRHAIKVMYDALRPGGRLIVTTVVDRTYWEEYRPGDSYGTQSTVEGGRFFFQRWYDADAIQGRLCAPIGQVPTEVRWFGEVTPGIYDAVIARWLSGDLLASVRSPRIIAESYREYSCWADMPGKGVGCFSFSKPVHSPSPLRP